MEQKARTTLYLTRGLVKEARVLAIQQGTSVSRIVEKLLKDYVLAKKQEVRS
jgi:hypothetical protein